MYKLVLISMALFALSSAVHAGLITVTTAPVSTYWTSSETVTLSNGTSTNITITNQCVAVSKYGSTNPGVEFTTGYTYGSGSVTQLLWSFANASISTSSTSPITVTFLTNAYGQANPCSVGVTHLDSNGVVCATAAASKLTIPVNVINPLLIMNTTSNWSANNTAYTELESQHGGVPMTIGTNSKYEYPNGGTTAIGCPYEYIYSIVSPLNSGAVSNNMRIYEITHSFKQYFRGTNLVYFTNYDSPSGQGAYYNPGPYFNWTTVSAPTNMIMYAADAPGYVEDIVQSNMTSNKYTSFIGTKTLVSYPLYNNNYVGIDTNTSAFHTFVLTCISSSTNGSGPYTWSVSY